MRYKNEHGRTMLEMLGVIAIMGIITYGAITGINYGMASYKINQTYNEVLNAVQGIQDLYSWTKTYPSNQDMMNVAAENDIFPGIATNKEDSNIKSFKGQFGDIKIKRIDGGDNFEVVYYGIKEDDCDRLLALEWESALVKMRTNEHTYEVTSACNEGDSNTLYFSPK